MDPVSQTAAPLSETKQELIVVLDFGAQYTQLIARRVRESRVYCEILPYDVSAAELRSLAPRGIIYSGGPSSVYDDNAPRVDTAIYDLNIPILGICYGQQLMAYQLGGNVQPAREREYGDAALNILASEPLFEGIGRAGETLTCWMSHGDLVLTPPAGFEIVATTENAPVAAMVNARRKLYGVQFHPEVAHTPFGTQLLTTFVLGPCGCAGTWTPANFVEEAVAKIRARVGTAGVVCGV